MPSVLIVSHCFPPDFSVGAKRALRMALHLGRFGWKVKVLTVRPSYFERLDTSLCADPVPYDTIRTHAIVPKHWLRRFLGSGRRSGGVPTSHSVRSSNGRPDRGGLLQVISSAWDVCFSIPDEHAGWMPLAVPWGLLHGGPADVVLASVPPRTSAVIAALLAGRFKAPLVIDYRDPWMPVPGEPQMPPWRQRLDRALERFCLKRASLVIATTEGLSRELCSGGAPRTVVVPNAFDSSVFNGIQAFRYDRFTVVYAGTLSGLRSASPILMAMGRLRQADRLPKSGMALRVLGASGSDVAAVAKRLGVADLVEVENFLPYREALSRMKGADVLLLVVAERHAHLIPAKLFDYLASRRFILALAPPGSDAGALVERLQAGCAIDPEDIGAVADALEQRFPRRGAEISLAPAAAQFEVLATMTELDRHLRSVVTGR